MGFAVVLNQGRRGKTFAQELRREISTSGLQHGPARLEERISPSTSPCLASHPRHPGCWAGRTGSNWWGWDHSASLAAWGWVTALLRGTGSVWASLLSGERKRLKTHKREKGTNGFISGACQALLGMAWRWGTAQSPANDIPQKHRAGLMSNLQQTALERSISGWTQGGRTCNGFSSAFLGLQDLLQPDFKVKH